MGKRITSAILIFTSLTGFLFARIKCGVPCSDAAVPFLFLEEEDYTVEVRDESKAVFDGLLDESLDAGVFPSDVAEKILEVAGNKLTRICVSQCQNSYVVSTDSSLMFLSGLLGKGVSVIRGNGSEVENFKEVLDRNQIPVNVKGGVVLAYDKDFDGLAIKMLGGSVQYAVLSEPYVTALIMKNPLIKRSIDLQEEMQQISGKENFSEKNVVLVRSSLLRTEPETVEKFLLDLETAVNKVSGNAGKAGRLFSEKVSRNSGSLISRAVPYLNYKFIRVD